MAADDPWPIEIKLDKDRALLTVTFDDGAELCAACRAVAGHEPERRGAGP